MLPTGGTVFFTVNDHDKPAAIELARRYVHLGFKIVATEGTANALEGAGLMAERVFKVKEGRPNVVDLIKGDRIQLDCQHAARSGHVLRREGDSPRGRAGAHSYDYDAGSGAGGGRGNRRYARAQHHGECLAAVAQGKRTLSRCGLRRVLQ